MEENKEMDSTGASSVDVYRCKAAKGLICCGWVILVVCILVSIYLLTFVYDAHVRENDSDFRIYFFSMLGTILGGYLIKSVLSGFAVIVEAQYRN